MHPKISALPSLLFYDSKLLDGPNLTIKCTAEWHSNPTLSPYQFFDIYKGRETNKAGSKSLYNPEEIAACIDLVHSICASYPKLNVFPLFLIFFIYSSFFISLY